MRNLFTFIFLLFFTVALKAQTVWVDEDFNGTSLPTGWTRTQATGSDGWVFGTPASISSTSFTIPSHTGNITGANDDECNCNASIDYIITPSFSIPTGATAVMQYDVFYGELSFSGVTENATIEISTDGGSTWTYLQDVPADANAWQTYFVDLSIYAGQTINVGFHYDDNGGWLYGIGLDNVKISEPVAEDASVSAVNIPPAANVNQTYNLSGVVTNEGSSTISALELFWSDGTNTFKDSLTGLNIAALGTYNFTHSTSINYATAGLYNLSVWTGDVNGSADLNNANDTFNVTLLVVDTVVQRFPLHEIFTSSTCGPCNPGNANTTSIFAASSEEPVIIKYQMSWPGSGDPYFTNEGNARRTYYGVNSVPNMAVDGGWNDNTNIYTGGLLTQFATVPAFMDITSDIRVECNTVFVDVTVYPYADFPATNNVLHVGIIENLTTQNIKSNGETEFDHVMKKMLPNAGGTTIGALQKDVPQTFTLSYSFNGNYILPPNANSPVNHSNAHTVEEFWDLDVVAFVQNNSTQEVYQATFSEDLVGFDMALTSINAISGATVSQPVVISGEMENWKDSAVAAIQINYSVDNGAPVSETISGLALNTKGSTSNFTFSTNWIPTTGGPHTVRIWVDNANLGSSVDGSNCNDTIVQVVNVAGGVGLPTASFTFSATNQTASFQSTSALADSWAWDFGDGNTSTFENPTHTYAQNGQYNVCLTVSNLQGSDSSCSSVSIGTVGLSNEASGSFDIYPNPSTGLFQIVGSNLLNGKMDVYNVMGKVVLTTELNNEKDKTIDLSKSKNGIYFIRITNNEGEVMLKKVIIE